MVVTANCDYSFFCPPVTTEVVVFVAGLAKGDMVFDRAVWGVAIGLLSHFRSPYGHPSEFFLSQFDRVIDR